MPSLPPESYATAIDHAKDLTEAENASTSPRLAGGLRTGAHNRFSALITAWIEANSMLVSTPAPHRVFPSAVRIWM